MVIPARLLQRQLPTATPPQGLLACLTRRGTAGAASRPRLACVHARKRKRRRAGRAVGQVRDRGWWRTADLDDSEGIGGEGNGLRPAQPVLSGERGGERWIGGK